MPKAQAAKTYPANDEHPTEHVTLAVDPYDMADKANIFSVKYSEQGFLPMFVVITNDGDEPVTVGGMNAQLVTVDRTKIPASSMDDIYRRLSHPTASASRGPLPFPTKKVKGTVSKEALDEMQNSQFAAKAIEPHSTQSGFMFFDVTGISTPLAGAHFYLTGVRDAKGNELMYFEIPHGKVSERARASQSELTDYYNSAAMASTPAVSAAIREKYEPVIGLEVHVQLLTQIKDFLLLFYTVRQSSEYKCVPGVPGDAGSLPVLNRKAVEFAVLAAMALNCRINQTSIFARKNYFYPDLPKGYQISQYDKPLAEFGWIDVPSGAGRKRIGITRVHLEEDAGKSLHDGFAGSSDSTAIDLNRSGVPLIEIVSEPDSQLSGRGV